MARFNDPVQLALDITDKIKDGELDYHEVLMVYVWKTTGWEELDYCAYGDAVKMYSGAANDETFKRALFYVVYWRMEDEMLQETVFNAKG